MNIPYADSLGFIGLPGQAPVFTAQRPKVSLMHVTSVPPFVDTYEAALAAHTAFRDQALQNKEVHEVLSRNDVGRGPGVGLLFGLQHAPKDMTPDRLQKVYLAGVRVMSIAYDKANEYGGGFKSTAGLTSKGKDLIRMMAATGIILDLSHANHQTARGALEMIFQESLFDGGQFCPMASHSGCSSVFPHPRNLPDDILKDISYLRGYVGIPAITFFLTKKDGGYMSAFEQHIAHAVNTCPDDTVGIGSDCPHIGMKMEEAREHFSRMQDMLKTNGSFGEYFPDRPHGVIESGNMMFELFNTVLEKFPGGVLGANFMNYLRRSLPQA
ncbi:MAG: membrane dipeptidase [Candidatus Paceibacterota bacterium]|jgi:microsomal dipeptidase-like Zn-dependent dipeptidase